MKLLIVDDHTLFRSGLAHLLQRRAVETLAAEELVGGGNDSLAGPGHALSLERSFARVIVLVAYEARN